MVQGHWIKRNRFFVIMMFCYVLCLVFYGVRACHREEEFVKVGQDGLSSINPLKTVTASRRAFCSTECIGNDACKSFVYLKQKSTANCLLSGNPDGERGDEGGETYKRQSSTPKVCLQIHCPKDRICTETCHKPFYSCSCLPWREGMFCENFNVVHLASTPWRVVPGNASNLDSGKESWAIHLESIWFLENNDWISIAGGLSQISSGKSGVWGLNRGGLVYMRVGVTEASPKGTSWTQTNGVLSQVTSGSFGVVYGINRNRDMFYRLGISANLQHGNGWKKFAGGNFIYVACGKYGCWVIKTGNTIIFRTGVTAALPVGNGWKVVDGTLKQLDAGPNGEVCGLDLLGKLWCRHGITEENPTGQKWKLVENVLFSHVSIGESNLFGLVPDGTIYAMP